MALQYSTTVRNAKLDTVESTIGTTASLFLFSGSAPANTSVANSGTLVAAMSLPSDWMAAASAGSKAKSGTWQDTSADASATIGHFRIFESTNTTCHVQGTCTNTGGGGDMTFDNVVVNSGQQVTISTFTLNAGNA